MPQEPEDFPLRIFTVESEPPNDALDDEPASPGWFAEPVTLEALEEAFEAFAAGNVESDHVLRLSDLNREQAGYVRTRWPELASEVRTTIVSVATDLLETSIAANFRRLLAIAVEDPSPAVRQFAVVGLGAFVDASGADLLLAHFTQDPSPDVRAEAAGSLALFADSFDYTPAGQAIEQRIRDTLLSYAAQPGEPETVRAMALESGSLFGDSEQLQGLIDAFYAEDETGLRLSALIAMGNSAAERWSAVLTSELFSDDNELRRAAATALGQIGNPDALPDLLKATRDTDLDTRHAAILAIGEIPGPASRRILNTLAADPLPEDARVIQEALAEERLFSLEPEEILDPDELPELDPDDEDLM